MNISNEFECSLCRDGYTTTGQNEPRILPCGHTFCISCIRKLCPKLCPNDRTEFRSKIEDLPKNLALLSILDGYSNERAASEKKEETDKKKQLLLEQLKEIDCKIIDHQNIINLLCAEKGRLEDELRKNHISLGNIGGPSNSSMIPCNAAPFSAPHLASDEYNVTSCPDPVPYPSLPETINIYNSAAFHHPASPSPAVSNGPRMYMLGPKKTSEKTSITIDTKPAYRAPVPGHSAAIAPPAPPAPPAPLPLIANSVIMTVEALFDHIGVEEDELTFLRGDMVHVLEKSPGGWWKGECNGRMGIFRFNYVKIL